MENNSGEIGRRKRRRVDGLARLFPKQCRLYFRDRRAFQSRAASARRLRHRREHRSAVHAEYHADRLAADQRTLAQSPAFLRPNFSCAISTVKSRSDAQFALCSKRCSQQEARVSRGRPAGRPYTEIRRITRLLRTYWFE